MLKSAGMDGSFCEVEWLEEKTCRNFRPGKDRLQGRKGIKGTISAAINLGLKTWCGFLVAYGETEEDNSTGTTFFDDVRVYSIALDPFPPPPPQTEPWDRNPVHPLQRTRRFATAGILMKNPDIFSLKKDTRWRRRKSDGYPLFINHSGWYVLVI
jgi:hypothetical protein